MHFYVERIDKIIQSTRNVCPESETTEMDKLVQQFETRRLTEPSASIPNNDIIGLQKSINGWQEVHAIAQ